MMAFTCPRARRALHHTPIAAAAALITALALAVPHGAVASGSSVAIVANLGGALTVRGAGGASHDVGGAQPLRSGDTVMTGVNSLASINLAGTMRVRLGTGTIARYFTRANSPGLRLDAGSLCVAADAPSISIATSHVVVTSVGGPAVFDVSTGSNGTHLVLYLGSISAGGGSGSPRVLNAPAALASTPAGGLATAPFAATAAPFASLQCPDRDDAIAKAQTVPSPSPEPTSVAAAPSGGGGGGILGVLAGIAGLAALAGGHGGGGGSAPPPPNPSPTPTQTPGTLGVSQPSLTFNPPPAPTQTFTASESLYHGSISATSGDLSVATVSGSGIGPGPVTFTVTAVGSGTTNITVVDDHGGTAHVAITVLAPGVLGVNPTSLTFSGPPTGDQPFTASESQYTGPISATSGDQNVATVSGGGNGPSAIFMVHAVAPGNTSITAHDNHGGTAHVVITVLAPGALTVVPTSFGTIAIDAVAQSLRASESNYSGGFDATSADTSIAVVTPAHAGNGVFSVTPAGVNNGSTHITVRDVHSHSVDVPITVAGPINSSKSSLSFNGTSTPQSFTATDPSYIGILSATSDNPGVATVAGGGTPPTDFTVTPVSQGSANITVRDTLGQSHRVTVSVSTGGLVVNPLSLAFYFNGTTGTPQTFTATQNNFNQTFTAHTGNAAVATVGGGGPGPGPVTFTVKPTGAGNTSITVTGNGSVDLPVTVSGPLLASPHTLTFAGTTSPQTFDATDPNFTGTITAISDDTTVATVTPTGPGPSATFTVTPVSSGIARITISDGVGGTDVVTVRVHTSNLTLLPASLTFLHASDPTQTFTATENNYTGNLALGGCAVASVTPSPGHGPVQIFTVTPVSAGTCSLTVTSVDHVATLPITVYGALNVNPTSLTFTDINQPQTVDINEVAYGGTFTVVSNTCSGVAVVGSPGGPGPTTTLTVTSSAVGSCSFAIQDDHGGSRTVNVAVGPFGSPIPSPASLSLSVTPPNNSGTFTVNESGYTGSFTASSLDCGPVATFNAGPATSFTVNAIAAGSCTINVHDDHGGTAAVTVNVAGALMVSPTSHTFMDIGLVTAINVSEANYTGPFTESNNTCSGIANVAAPSGPGPNATIGVTSVAAGSCAFTVSDSFSASVVVSITVGPFGTVMPAPNPLTIDTSVNTSGTIVVSESGYSGQFTATTSDCTGIASFPAGPATSFLVNAIAAGTCHIQFADDHGGNGSGTVVVDGALTLAPNPVNFTDINITTPIAINEPNFTGAFSVANNLCAGIATVGSPAGPGPSTTLNVKSLAQGTCTFAVQDGLGQSVVETVNVGPFGLPTPSTTQMMLNTVGPLTGTFTISESGYTGNFALNPSTACVGVLSVAPGSGNAATTFTVTATGALVGTCGIRIVDDAGQNANVEVEVTGGTLSVNPASLSFASSTSPAQIFAATDGTAINFTCTSSDPLDVSATITSGSGSATCSVAPTNTVPGFVGTAQITVGDSNLGSSAVVQVGVGTSPLSKHRRSAPGGVRRPLPHEPAHRVRLPVVPGRPLPKPVAPRIPIDQGRLLPKPANRPPPLPAVAPFALSEQQVALPGPGAQHSIIVNVFAYRGTLQASSSGRTIADVSAPSGTLAIRIITIIAKAPGMTIIRIVDDRGDEQVVKVIVGTSAPMPGRPIPAPVPAPTPVPHPKPLPSPPATAPKPGGPPLD